MGGKVQIVYKPIDEIIPYVNNPRNNERAVDAVASSIKNFGFKVPIVIDSENEIVNGHTRLLAAKKLGLEEVPVLIADDLSEEQVKAFRLADNKVGELATWDEELLQAELSELISQSVDMMEYGFTDADFAEVENEAEEDVAKLMGGQELDLWLTDPPYNVALGKSDLSADSLKRHRRQDGLTIMNDDMEDSDFLEFLTKAFGAAKTVMKPGGSFYIWHADNESYNFRLACRQVGLQVRQCLVWVKSSITLGRQDYQWIHEPCLYGWKDGASHYFTFDRTQATVIEDRPNLNKMNKDELKEYILAMEEAQGPTSIIREKKPSSSKEHPTMKPIKLLSRQVLNSSKKGQNVGDFFGGSGSTLIACEQLERNCFTMELDPRYADVIIDRWEKLTGEQATKISD